jgi:hypothetical protein
VYGTPTARNGPIYLETPGGGRVDIVTTDREALSALHEFLRYQIAEHRTADPLTVNRRP